MTFRIEIFTHDKTIHVTFIMLWNGKLYKLFKISLVGKSHLYIFGRYLVFTSIFYFVDTNQQPWALRNNAFRAYHIFRDWQVRHYFFCELKTHESLVRFGSQWDTLFFLWTQKSKTHESRFGNEKISCSHIQVLYSHKRSYIAFRVEIFRNDFF